MIKINMGQYSYLDFDADRHFDRTDKQQPKESETKEEFFNRFIRFIKENEYHSLPRFVFYNANSDNIHNCPWDYIDWINDSRDKERVIHKGICFIDVLALYGQVDEFYDNVLRLIKNNEVYVFWSENCGYGDIEQFVEKMTIQEWNKKWTIRK